ncbi:hypothetical protein BS50DRAFT_587457 [Corynespora cassiicola Philippines]|uniref:Uncharacterized protein n=1 Tax=Corynespora cassiicola Philippines TaxID=1448308 RepID=A0A2T2NT55_CORCC|nr:hypothetical protein BS50DRAFT_587457 [Corynespora cassiicola Philippines]
MAREAAGWSCRGWVSTLSGVVREGGEGRGSRGSRRVSLVPDPSADCAAHRRGADVVAAPRARAVRQVGRKTAPSRRVAVCSVRGRDAGRAWRAEVRRREYFSDRALGQSWADMNSEARFVIRQASRPHDRATTFCLPTNRSQAGLQACVSTASTAPPWLASPVCAAPDDSTDDAGGNPASRRTMGRARRRRVEGSFQPVSAVVASPNPRRDMAGTQLPSSLQAQGCLLN